ncbi:hypothetical protein BJF90_09440 [Pseudonocardia sp. CNS-004]|nr:hypothetical protein BJF90_09440 [Pseudonocardia sp. CNS-004]
MWWAIARASVAPDGPKPTAPSCTCARPDTHGRPVELAAVAGAEGAVAGADVGGVTGAGERLAGPGGAVGVDVDGDDLTVRPGELDEQGGVVAGAGPDLQDPVTGVDVELVEHHRDDPRGGRELSGAPPGSRFVTTAFPAA